MSYTDGRIKVGVRQVGAGRRQALGWYEYEV